MNAKELILGRLNITLSNAIILSATTALGINLKDSVDFINHPIVNSVYQQLDASRNHQLVKSDKEKEQSFKSIESIITQTIFDNIMDNLPVESPLKQMLDSSIDSFKLKRIYKELLNFITNSVTLQENKELSLDNQAKLNQLQKNIDSTKIDKSLFKLLSGYISADTIAKTLRHIIDLSEKGVINAADIYYTFNKLTEFIKKAENINDRTAKNKASQILNLISIKKLTDKNLKIDTSNNTINVTVTKTYKNLEEVSYKKPKSPTVHYNITLNNDLNISAIFLQRKGLRYATEDYFKSTGITNTPDQQLSALSKLLKKDNGIQDLQNLVATFFINPNYIFHSLNVDSLTPKTTSGEWDMVTYSTIQQEGIVVPPAGQMVVEFISYNKQEDGLNKNISETQAAYEIANIMNNTDNKLLDQLFRFHKIGQSLNKLAKMLAINQGNPNRLESLLSFVKSLEVYINNLYISTGIYVDKNRFEFNKFFSNDREYIENQIKMFDNTNNKVFNILLILDNQKHYNTYLQSVINEWKMIEKMSFTSETVKAFLDSLTELRQHESTGRYYRLINSLNNKDTELALDVDLVKEIQSFVEDRKVIYYLKNGINKPTEIGNEIVTLEFNSSDIRTYDLTKFSERSQFLIDFTNYVPSVLLNSPDYKTEERSNPFLNSLSNTQIKDRLTKSPVILLEGSQFNQLSPSEKIILEMGFKNLKTTHKRLFFLYDLISKSGLSSVIDLDTKKQYNDFISDLVEDSDKRSKFIRHLTNPDEKIIDLFLQINQRTPSLFTDVSTQKIKKQVYTGEDDEGNPIYTTTTEYNTVYKGLYDGSDNVNPKYFSYGDDFTTIIKNNQWSEFEDTAEIEDVTETFDSVLARLASDVKDSKSISAIKHLFGKRFGIFEILKYQPGSIAKAIIDTDSVLTYDKWRELVVQNKDLKTLPISYRTNINKIDALLQTSFKDEEITETVAMSNVEKTPVNITALNKYTDELSKIKDINTVIQTIESASNSKDSTLSIHTNMTGKNLLTYVYPGTSKIVDKTITSVVIDTLINMSANSNNININSLKPVLKQQLQKMLVENKLVFETLYENLYGTKNVTNPKALQILLRLPNVDTEDSLFRKLKNRGVTLDNRNILNFAYLIGRVNTNVVTSENSTEDSVKYFKGLNLIGQLLTEIITTQKTELQAIHKNPISSIDLLNKLSETFNFKNYTIDSTIESSLGNELKSDKWNNASIKSFAIKTTLFDDTHLSNFNKYKIVNNPFETEKELIQTILDSTNTADTKENRNKIITNMFMDWLLGNNYKNKYQNYRSKLLDTILNDLENKTNNLIGKEIIYSQNTKYNHAKALSLLLNSYNNMFNKRITTLGMNTNEINNLFKQLFEKQIIKPCK